ncbi:MAG: DUF4912 domain-containing protein [Elusimicrobia bacterium]|nr:DUF4912 domain-containing protein [Elusimicrobiota bacterium]MBD3411829.1 DUF4912 domain-containing protein [Elusimicrobiota bacterium]
MKLTKEKLKKSSKKELISQAKSASVKGYSRMSREKLIDALVEQQEESTRLVQNSGVPSSNRKKTPPSDSESETMTQSKYYVAPSTVREPDHQPVAEVPNNYGLNRIVLLVRDPFWLHTYWELTPHHIAAVRNTIQPERFHGSTMALRVTDVTDIRQDCFYIKLNVDARNWYINVTKANRAYRVDIGFQLADGSFLELARSNTVRTPRAGMSDVFDEQWMTKEDYELLYRLSGGYGKYSSAEFVKELSELVNMEYFSAGASEQFMSGGDTKNKKKNNIH